MASPDESRIMELLDRFGSLRIWVIGDLMLDHFVWGDVERISPEAPVPVVRVESERMMPGGAANVATNLSGLGVKVTLVGVVGRDAAGRNLLRILEKRRISTSGIISTRSRETTVKTRVVAHGQHVVRFDRERASPLSKRLKNQILDFFHSNRQGFDALVVSDYGKGLIDGDLFAEIVDFCKAHDRFLAVDPYLHHFFFYRRASLVTPNQHQFEAAINRKCGSQRELEKEGRKILKELELKYFVVTQGERGMTVFQRGDRPHRLPTFARQVYDVTGAGDTVIAMLALALAAGTDISEAAMLANLAAGIVVEEVGTTAITRDKIVNRLKDKGWLPSHE